MAFKIKDLMINIAPSRAEAAGGDNQPQTTGSGGLPCQAGASTDIGNLKPEAGRFGCPGRHTDFACPPQQSIVGGCTGRHTDVATCRGEFTDATGCPGRHTDIVIGIDRDTDLAVCIGRHTDAAATCRGRHTDIDGCTGRHTDAGAWKDNPEIALDELNAIKAQLTAELTRIDNEIREIEDGLQPKTVEQVEALQGKLQEALDELGKIKSELEKK